MWLYALRHPQAAEPGEQKVTAQSFQHLLLTGWPSKKELSVLWEKQKIEKNYTNLLDHIHPGTDFCYADGEKFQEKRNMKTDDRVFQQLRENYAQWAEQGLPQCDNLCVPWLEFFNAQAGLASVFCCQGHAPRGKPYIMFAFNEDGLKFLEQAIDELNASLVSAGQYPSMTLTLRCKLNPVRFPERDPYLAAILSWDFMPVNWSDRNLQSQKCAEALPIVQQALTKFCTKTESKV